MKWEETHTDMDALGPVSFMHDLRLCCRKGCHEMQSQLPIPGLIAVQYSYRPIHTSDPDWLCGLYHAVVWDGHRMVRRAIDGTLYDKAQKASHYAEIIQYEFLEARKGFCRREPEQTLGEPWPLRPAILLDPIITGNPRFMNVTATLQEWHMLLFGEQKI